MLNANPVRQTYADALSRLVFSLRRAKSDGHGAALLLGAGCSLTSARDDVSTTSIIRSVVAEVQPQDADTDDASLYRVFVKHWRNLTPDMRRSLIEQRLQNLEPSAGYLALRRLTELQYVTHIVTTNFDTLIDEVLTGIDFSVRVGAAAWRPKRPHAGALGLIKVHGDIREGQLRFDPKDLDALPKSIGDEIRRATNRPTVVCGFRGQDRGLMGALSNDDAHPAFWSSPEFPDPQQDYLYDRLDAYSNRLSMIANAVPVRSIGKARVVLSALAEMSAPADLDAADVSVHARAKRAVLVSGQSLTIHDAKARLSLGEVGEDVFREIVASYLQHLPGGHVSKAGHFESDVVDVVAGIVAAGERPSRKSTNLVAAVMARTATLPVSAFPGWETIELGHDEEVDKFLAGPVPAAFLVRPSGAGKSTTVQRLARSGSGYASILLTGRTIELDKPVWQSFFGADLAPDQARMGRFIERLDAALRLRDARLLLTLDGLNEAGAQARELKYLFSTVIELADRLFDRAATNIKLLVTSQERTLQSLLESAPSAHMGTFYRPRVVSPEAPVEPIIRTHALTAAEQQDIVRAGFPSDRASVFAERLRKSPALQAAFHQPILLNIASQLPSASVEALIGAPSRVFDEYRQLLMSRAAQASSGRACETVIRTYFELLLAAGNGARVQRFVLLQRSQAEIGVSGHIALKALEDVGVFDPDPSGVIGYVAFRHERLEIALLADFIDSCAPDTARLTNILRSSERSAALLESLRALLTRKVAVNPDEDRFLSAFFSRNFEEFAWMSSVLANAVLDTADPIAAPLFFQFARRAGDEAPESLSRALARGLLSLIGYGRSVRSACEAVLEESSRLSAERAGRAELHLAASHGAYDEDDRARAEQHAEAAAEHVGHRQDAKLIRRIDLQRARILGRWHSRKRALEILRGQFDDIITNGPQEAAVECALELGEMLRDAALFDEAIAVYRRATEFSANSTEILKQRLHLGEAVAHKNKMQLVLRDARRNGRAPTEKEVGGASELFQVAMEAFEEITKWARAEGAVALLLAALSERSEASIILSWARPDMRSTAQTCLHDLEEGLRVQEVVTHRIEWGRQVARLAENEGHFEAALTSLTQARSVALAAAQAYNVCDCDYQIGRLALFAMLSGDRSLLSDGVAALDRAASYLREETSSNNAYLDDILDIAARLRHSLH